MATVRIPLQRIDYKENLCGPASLAMVLKHKGINVSQDDIATMIKKSYGYDVTTTGTFYWHLANLPQQFGFKARTLYGIDMMDIFREIDAGNPIISRQTMAIGRDHFNVINGYDTESSINVLIVDPAIPNLRGLSWKGFKNRSDTFGHYEPTIGYGIIVGEKL